MNIFKMFRRKPNTETLQKKAAVDKAYARFMAVLVSFDYWRDLFEPEYKAQPLKIDHEAKQ